MKVDCLALGMLGCMKRGFDLLAEHKGIELDLATIPAEDPRTYAMIRKADTVGVFQIESRAQMAMLPRMKPRTFYDLVIEVAIVRPGPIQGDMVHPYLRRREGKEAVVYPEARAEQVLGKTLGVPLFQEQAMRVAIECAGFTAGRGRSAPPRHGDVQAHRRGRALPATSWSPAWSRNGYDAAFAERTFKQLEGFGSYGFPESHAASFALIAYASSWMKCHHPDVFCARSAQRPADGLLRAGADRARCAGTTASRSGRSDVNASRWDCTLEAAGDGPASPCGSGLRHGARPGQRRWRAGSSPRAASGRSPASTISGAGPACRVAAWCGSPRPTLSGIPGP